MRVTLFPCGPAANESELKGFEHLKNRLQSELYDEEWVLLTNLAFSVTHQLQSDEIDLVVIGPTGVQVIEVKHWTAQWFDAHRMDVEDEADRVTNKARKVGTTLRRVVPKLPRVDGAILLTQEPSKVKRLAAQEVRGVRFHTLNDWKAAIGFEAPRVLSPQQVKQLPGVLQPRSAVAIDGSLRRLAGYVNLELQTPRDQRFHRVYKGSHPARRDRVVLHLYDLSASDDKNAEVKAKREFEALHRLQLHSWAPRILDSYQDAPGYAGEMFFFTVVDPAAPCIEERGTDTTWTASSRLAFARNVVRALAELHAAGTHDEPIIHRNLTPRTILVKHDNSPIITGFERSRLPSENSIASSSLPTGEYLATAAPEVKAQGLAVADQRSDLYSLCACLSYLFQGRDDDLSRRAGEVFAHGLARESDQRGTLQGLDAALAELLGESIPPPAPPPARFWTEDQVIRFHDRDYRIVSRLGSGGVGTTFKVVEIDRSTSEDLGTYVAKVAHDGATGRRVLKAYSLVRSHLRHTALSTIFEVAREYQENEFVALMTWISGAPLAEFAGVFPLLAEEQQETSSEALALRWLRIICEALDVLHRNGLIHGDVSPRNLIVSGSDLVLTDYDFVRKIGEPMAAPGTVLYCSPSYLERRPASPSDDLYALAATFFHVIFEKEPFRYGGELDKKRGLNWEGVSRKECPILAALLDKATHPDPQLRFANVAEALAALKIQEPRETSTAVEERKPEQPEPAATVNRTERRGSQPELREQRVEWLLSLLQSYPGSRWGNRETRGLDTEFAAQTYVETALEETLVRDIRERRVRLVVLCGNAGDGKTALLQHLAARLGLGEHRSSERILEGRVPSGPLVRMNLDGSASWRGRSADEILDEFLAPFQDGSPTQDFVHLLAINDGRLLEWIERFEGRHGGNETLLTAALYEMLQQEAATQKSHIRFISLNQRSLVGGITPDRRRIDTTFLERLIDHLYGGEQAAEIWSACQSCSAKDRCEVFRAARFFAPDTLQALAEPSVRSRARQRLFEALQAVHLRAEIHITMRELRAAMVYILFGVHFCDDHHAESASEALPYWDRAFSADSPARQGEVLGELARFDPALEAHPQIDRHLLRTPAADSAKTAPHYPQITLESARRRAFFEWTPEDIEQVAGDRDALDLARGRHLRLFRNLPLADERELAEVCERLCKGISRLEDLPPQALDRPGVVPLRITPRTQTETAFWVEKPLRAFRLGADLPQDAEGVERLHRQAFLVYRYRNDRDEERLRLGAELFHLLLELADGYQLGDVSTDDTFAHLSIFVQRLVREDERELLAWNPMQDDAIYQVSAAIRETESGPQQRMIITPLASGAQT
jgi:serine/threonine protein kinase